MQLYFENGTKICLPGEQPFSTNRSSLFMLSQNCVQPFVFLKQKNDHSFTWDFFYWLLKQSTPYPTSHAKEDLNTSYYQESSYKGSSWSCFLDHRALPAQFLKTFLGENSLLAYRHCVEVWQKKKTKTVIAQPSSPWAGHHLAWATARRGDPHLAWWSSPMLVRGSPWTWADLGIPSGSTQPIQNILFLHHNNFDYTHENSWLTPHALNKRECTYFLYKQKALFFIF
jgi:hypothetical protein